MPVYINLEDWTQCYLSQRGLMEEDKEETEERGIQFPKPSHRSERLERDRKGCTYYRTITELEVGPDDFALSTHKRHDKDTTGNRRTSRLREIRGHEGNYPVVLETAPPTGLPLPAHSQQPIPTLNNTI